MLNSIKRATLIFAIISLAICGLSMPSQASTSADPGSTPDYSTVAAQIQEQMQDPKVIAKAQKMLNNGSFAVSTTDPVDPQSISFGGCGWGQLCIYFNRTEQRYIATGSGAAVGAAICIVGSPVACGVAAVLIALALQFVSERGGICSGSLRVRITPWPGGATCV